MTAVQEYQLTKVKISDLKFDPTNPNTLTKDQEQALTKTMKRFGYLVPVIINENYEIGDGEHRAKLYQQLGLTEIPAYIVPKINDDIERRLLRQTMNKLRGEHEIKMDADEIALIFQNKKLDDLSELLATQRNELEDILIKHKGMQFQREDEFDIDKALEDIVPVTELGDIWQLGRHRIICADCSDERSIKKLMQDKKADMVFTDPPYNLNYDFHDNGMVQTGQRTARFDKIENDNLSKEDFKQMILNSFSLVRGCLNNGASFYVCGRRESTILFNQVLEQLGFHIQSWIIWVKEHFNISRLDYHPKHEVITYGWKKGSEHKWFSDRGQVDVWVYERQIGKTQHPNTKPIEMISYSLKNSTEENNIILDSFLGSGSTLIACEQTNRICYGVEIDPHYVDVICQRFKAFTGQEAINITKDNKTYSELRKTDET